MKVLRVNNNNNREEGGGENRCLACGEDGIGLIEVYQEAGVT